MSLRKRTMGDDVLLKLIKASFIEMQENAYIEKVKAGVSDNLVWYTLFGNPKGSVEQGNRNICAETKLCLIFFIPAQEVVCYEPEPFIQLASATF